VCIKYPLGYQYFCLENKLIGRLDYVVGPKDLIFLQVSWDPGTQPTFTDPINSVFNSTSYQPEWNGQFNWTHTFTETLQTSFILREVARSQFDATNPTLKQAAFPTQLNVNGLLHWRDNR